MENMTQDDYNEIIENAAEELYKAKGTMEAREDLDLEKALHASVDSVTSYRGDDTLNNWDVLKYSSNSYYAMRDEYKITKTILIDLLVSEYAYQAIQQDIRVEFTRLRDNEIENDLECYLKDFKFWEEALMERNIEITYSGIQARLDSLRGFNDFCTTVT